MQETVLVVGARGRLGRIACEEFTRRRWTVRALVRPGRHDGLPDGIEVVEADACSSRDLIEAAEGADAIFNAFNAPFHRWHPEMLENTEATIAAARASGATHLFPGNVYNYGFPLPEVIQETDPQRPSARKGHIRVEVERRYQEAASLFGVRTIVLRAGDFYGGGGRGSWFDRVIADDAAKGKMLYPGPANLPHAWAYLPDYVAAFEALARQRHTFSPFEAFHFPGHTVTGADMADALAAATGRPMQVNRMPWRLIRLASPFVRAWREIGEIAYLWHLPHRLDGTKLEMALGDIPATSFERAVNDSLDALGIDTRPAAPAARRLAPA
jgi:nucleoside-diphosphate-sugar epimerase